MIRTPDSFATTVRFLLGNSKCINDTPEVLFHPLRLAFLADLSRVLIADNRSKQFPDLVTFAFWCRKANINHLIARRDHSRLRVGLGLVFHISPANVPINFAYSLVFSLLAGNTSVVRLSSIESAQTDLVIESLARLLAEERYISLQPAIHLIRYDKADEVTEFWLTNSHGRIVWGGDATIAHVRSLKTHPRSREIAFVDRYSFCVLNARRVAEATDVQVKGLCTDLYNDIYLMDQNACSSPQLLVWIGEPDAIEVAQKKLWPKFQAYAHAKYSPEPVLVMDKFVNLCREVIDFGNISTVVSIPPSITRIQLTALLPNQCQQRGYFGTVHEFIVTHLDALAPVIDTRFQTITYFGFAQQDLREFVVTNHLSGIDRIVPVGKALSMDFYWDGFDILSSLSRLVDIQ